MLLLCKMISIFGGYEIPILIQSLYEKKVRMCFATSIAEEISATSILKLLLWTVISFFWRNENSFMSSWIFLNVLFSAWTLVVIVTRKCLSLLPFDFIFFNCVNLVSLEVDVMLASTSSIPLITSTHALSLFFHFEIGWAFLGRTWKWPTEVPSQETGRRMTGIIVPWPCFSFLRTVSNSYIQNSE